MATISVKVGQTYKWTLGGGAPIYGPRVIEGGLAVSIIVSDSEAAVRRWGTVLSKVSDAFDSKPDLMSLVAGLANPGGFTAQAAFEVLGRAVGVVGEVLELQPDKRIGAYSGLFSAKGSWKGKLSQAQNGASITLSEMSGYS
jgi:hypothetical protein